VFVSRLAVDRVKLFGEDFCKMISSPIDNSDVEREDGTKIPIEQSITIKDGDHFTVTRLRVGGN